MSQSGSSNNYRLSSTRSATTSRNSRTISNAHLVKLLHLCNRHAVQVLFRERAQDQVRLQGPPLPTLVDQSRPQCLFVLPSPVQGLGQGVKVVLDLIGTFSQGRLRKRERVRVRHLRWRGFGLWVVEERLFGRFVVCAFFFCGRGFKLVRAK